MKAKSNWQFMWDIPNKNDWDLNQLGTLESLIKSALVEAVLVTQHLSWYLETVRIRIARKEAEVKP